MRTIDAPGIEINEIDASQYGQKPDLNKTGVLVTGFADRGEDYTIQNVASMSEFIRMYGYPSNEAERYFYNAALEIFNTSNSVNLANLYMAKLPYDNESLDKVSFTSYLVNEVPFKINPVDDALNLRSSDGTILSNLLTSTNPVIISKENAKTFYQFMLDTCNFTASSLETVKLFFNTTRCFKNLSSIYIGAAEDLQNYNPDRLGSNAYFRNQDTNINIYNAIIKNANYYTYDICITEYLKSLNLADILYFLNGLLDNKFVSSIAKEFIYLLNTKEFSYSDIRKLDNSITSYIEIHADDRPEGSGLKTFEEYDSLITKTYDIKKNSIIIVNTSRSKYDRDVYYEKDINKSKSSQYIGIVPVITTAANAINYQELLRDKGKQNFKKYSAVGSFKVISNPLTENQIDTENTIKRFAIPLNDKNIKDDSISNRATMYFPAISFSDYNKLDKTYLKQIGIVIFRMVLNPSNNLIDYIPLEAFVGSLNSKSRNTVNGEGLFIDEVVNNSSKYINVFSNVEFYNDKNIPTEIERASLMTISNQTITSLGFFASQCIKNITLDTSINNALDIILAHASDTKQYELDIIVDAGVSNIGQYILTTKRNVYNPEYDVYKLFRLVNENSVYEWRKILLKFNELCKNNRRDCIFIADGLRNFCIEGNSKIVRKSKPENTIKKDILPKIKYLTGIDSSYAAGYCNWFLTKDMFSGRMFWCPPSIKAMGRYLYTDIMYKPWDAPAGFKRGVVPNVYDLAFNPSNEEAGVIYTNFWNYAMGYPLEGVVIEGQRTFQRNKTAFDRINVRRLFLFMEKRISNIAKYFLYDGITTSQLNRFKDLVINELNIIQNNNGILEYYVICDERNNNAETADNNEIHCTVAVRPVKTAEFIVLNFLCANQTANLEELTTSII